MRKGVALFGVCEETLALVPLLEANPTLEIAALYDEDATAARERIEALDPRTAERLLARLVEDAGAIPALPNLHAVVEADDAESFDEHFPEVAGRGVQIVSPLTARLLWGYGTSGRNRQEELLQALHEVVESVNLTIDAGELFSRMLEIALSVTGADGGSLMLLDHEHGVLRIRVASGVERELWPKIQVALGDGIAGRVAAEARPLRLRGKADQDSYKIVRERFDVESALCVPLVHHGRVLGVLNLHHSSEPDAFSDDDLEFAERLGRLDAEIIARAQEHEQLRSQAARYEAVREAQRALSGRAPILERLGALCQVVARRAEGGIATIYLYDEGEQELRLAATSLPGGGFGGDYRVVMGQGVDGGAAKTRQPAFLYAPDRSLAYGALPMLSGSNLAGVLSVQAGRKPSGAGARDTRVLEETLQEIAACTADEVAQADREARMSSRATKVSAINEAGIRLMSARDPDEAARLATSSAALILEADHVVMRLQDPDTRRYVIRSYYGSGDGRFEERLFLLDKQACVEAIRRRSAFLLRDPATRPGFEEVESEVRSLLAAPLKREGKVVGTLALYDKVAADQFYPGSFDDEDLAVFMKYVSYVERALEAAAIYQRASQQRNFDEQTGLPNADYLDRRIDQEIARAGGREGSLAVVSCLVENLDEIRRSAGPRGTDRVVERTAASLRAHLRDFDVLGRTGDGEFIALLPDPGPAPDERVAQLARGIADDIAKDDALNDPVRVALAFGYGIHPSDGPARPALLEQAREPRIRMV